MNFNAQGAWYAVASAAVEVLRTWVHHESHVGRSGAVQLVAAGIAPMIPFDLTTMPLLNREIYVALLRALASLGLGERQALLHAIDSVSSDLAGGVLYSLFSSLPSFQRAPASAINPTAVPTPSPGSVPPSNATLPLPRPTPAPTVPPIYNPYAG